MRTNRTRVPENKCIKKSKVRKQYVLFQVKQIGEKYYKKNQTGVANESQNNTWINHLWFEEEKKETKNGYNFREIEPNVGNVNVAYMLAGQPASQTGSVI